MLGTPTNWIRLGLSALLACAAACDGAPRPARPARQAGAKAERPATGGLTPVRPGQAPTAWADGTEPSGLPVDVAILETEEVERALPASGPERGASGEQPERVLAVKIKVTNNTENLKVPVSRQLFRLEVESGRRILPLTSGPLAPALESCHLEGGSVVSGWLFFAVSPGERKSPHLTANFRTPNLRIPLGPGEPSD